MRTGWHPRSEWNASHARRQQLVQCLLATQPYRGALTTSPLYSAADSPSGHNLPSQSPRNIDQNKHAAPTGLEI